MRSLPRFLLPTLGFFFGIAARGAEITPGPMEMAAGKGRFNGLFQTWALSDSTSARNTFRMRRAELRFGGSLLEGTRWSAMIDAAKALRIDSRGTLSPSNDNSVLQDLLLGISFSERWELVIGQFKTQTTSEGLDSSSDLLFPERSTVARLYGDRRQPGVMLVWQDGKEWKVSGMISNGGETNTLDSNVAKDLSSRGEWSPLEGFGLGGFVAAGDTDFEDRGTYGLNVRWKGEAETLRAEAVLGKRVPSTGGASVSTRGYVLDAAYRFMPALEGLVRYENYRPDTDGDFTSSAATVGLNYRMSKNAVKFQLAYTFLYNMTGSGNGSYFVSSSPTSRGRLFIAAFQMAI